MYHHQQQAQPQQKQQRHRRIIIVVNAACELAGDNPASAIVFSLTDRKARAMSFALYMII
jgi:hypothetical protein